MADSPERMTVDDLMDQVQQQQYYGNRGLRNVLPIGDWRLEIRALPTAVYMHLSSQNDEYKRAWDTVRFGVTGWQGLKDRDGAAIEFKGEKVFIWEREYEAVSRDLMDLIPPYVIGVIRRAVDAMATLTLQEQRALDFTAPSAETSASGEAATDNATAAAAE